MDSYMSFPTMTPLPCDLHSKCSPCLSYPFCAFLILLNGMGICVDKKESSEYQNRTFIEITYIDDCTDAAYDMVPKSALQHREVVIGNDQLKMYYRTVATPSFLKDHNATTVTIRLDVNSFKMDEVASVFHLYGKILLQWQDTTLDDPVHYSITDHWWPLLSVKYDVHPKKEHPFGDMILWVNNNTVTGELPVSFSSRCILSLLHWPLDTQTCHVAVLVSSGKVGHRIKLELLSVATNHTQKDVGYVGTRKKTEPILWSLVSSSALTESTYCLHCEKPYVVYSLTFTRNPTGLLNHLVIVLVVNIVLLFFMGFQSHFKRCRMFTIPICFCGVTSVLGYLFECMPPTGLQTPLIIQLYLCSSLFCGVSIVCTAFAVALSKIRKLSPTPKCINRVFFNRHLLTVLHLYRLARRIHGHLNSNTGGNNSSSKDEGIELRQLESGERDQYGSLQRPIESIPDSPIPGPSGVRAVPKPGQGIIPIPELGPGPEPAENLTKESEIVPVNDSLPKEEEVEVIFSQKESTDSVVVVSCIKCIKPTETPVPLYRLELVVPQASTKEGQGSTNPAEPQSAPLSSSALKKKKKRGKKKKPQPPTEDIRDYVESPDVQYKLVKVGDWQARTLPNEENVLPPETNELSKRQRKRMHRGATNKAAPMGTARVSSASLNDSSNSTVIMADMVRPSKPNRLNDDWINLVVVLDRIALTIYSFTTMFLGVRYMLNFQSSSSSTSSSIDWLTV